MTIRSEIETPLPSRRLSHRPGIRLATALWLLWPATGLNACAPIAPQTPVIPASLLTHPRPKPYPDPATATQADLTAALADTYFAWEGTAENLDLIKAILTKKEP